MFKKTASFLWALFVITTLMISQAQTVLAMEPPDPAAPVDAVQTVAAKSVSVESAPNPEIPESRPGLCPA